CFASFVDQFLLLSLIATRSVCRPSLLAASLFFERLLLASREFFQTAFGFALLLLSLLLLRALHRFILVLHLVEFELVKTCEFLLLSLTTAAATAAILITKCNLHFA